MSAAARRKCDLVSVQAVIEVLNSVSDVIMKIAPNSKPGEAETGSESSGPGLDTRRDGDRRGGHDAGHASTAMQTFVRRAARLGRYVGSAR